MRVLAFEDTYDLEALLCSAKVDLTGVELLQRWDSNTPIQHIIKFNPDVVLLDYLMPPHTGLEVLRMINEAVAKKQMPRPSMVVGISSEAKANQALAKEGADDCIIKFDLHRLSIWKQENSISRR